MVELPGREEDGFIALWYKDLVGVGHRSEKLRVMCEEFFKDKYGDIWGCLDAIHSKLGKNKSPT